jgi:hypothetical protein
VLGLDVQGLEDLVGVDFEGDVVQDLHVQLTPVVGWTSAQGAFSTLQHNVTEWLLSDEGVFLGSLTGRDYHQPVQTRLTVHDRVELRLVGIALGFLRIQALGEQPAQILPGYEPER